MDGRQLIRDYAGGSLRSASSEKRKLGDSDGWTGGNEEDDEGSK